MSGYPWRGLHRALTLALAPVVALGFTRFAYALLLPGMQDSLQWNLAQAGALNTANGAGFLLGAMTASRLAARWGTARVFAATLALSSLALLLSAWLDAWLAFLLVRGIGGAATACAFVLGSALAPLTMPQRPAVGMAVYFAGTGLGMVVAGATYGSDWFAGSEQPWRLGWTLMGGAGVIAAAISARVAFQLPSVERGCSGRTGAPLLRDAIAPTLVANSLYGAGYVGYTTFVIALLAQRGYGVSAATLVFCAIGAASMLASPAWGRWLQTQPGGRGFAVVSALLSAGLMPVLLSDHLLAVATSALLFGGVFMAGPAAVSVVAQRELGAADAARGLGALTAAFSLGQSIGPVLAGALADATGRLESGLWLGPVLLLAGAAIASAQRGGRWDPRAKM
ncbi:YbfB/YjiJ family MFS transporter [Ramlibacter tataouinensis]|uniref:YbfB/YjiJ family MFS transporter n=1 Tax=Ramlibacter tataouinensis TaxID=94132 RepID=UPI0022F38B17|nr:YbfB/YjiJ family MFS transporter [Ramlibacter tataouinensis]WBY01238.1 YbfB/YjiJ family MFS transporter [Ramlibacter tataouinensis]